MKIEISSEIKALTSEALKTKEQVLAVESKGKKLSICIPREIHLQENRLALSPEAAALLVNNGHEVCVEAGAGNGAKFPDKEFSEAGAKICYSPEELYKSGDIILKINPPTLEEIEMMEQGAFRDAGMLYDRIQSRRLKTITTKFIACALQ
jgi:alanine dehydrogenase